MCDGDVRRRMVFGFEERREQMRKREQNRKNEKEEREISGKENNFFFFLQNCYSAILSLELHCSSITNLFAIGYIVFQM